MSAIFSPCGNYRYRLERSGPGRGATAIVMVNPSTADAETDDATIRKLRGFGERHGWGRLIVGNLFAWRATDVRELGRVGDPVGPDNDRHLAEIFADADRAVLAWGPLAKQPRFHRGRWREVLEMCRAKHRKPLAIGEPARCGQPKHPLMLGYGSPVAPWFPCRGPASAAPSLSAAAIAGRARSGYSAASV